MCVCVCGGVTSGPGGRAQRDARDFGGRRLSLTVSRQSGMADFGAAAAAEAAEPPAACLSADEQALGAKRALDAALAGGLPVARCAGALAEAVQAHTSLVVVGETGSGKTTLLPQVRGI